MACYSNHSVGLLNGLNDETLFSELFWKRPLPPGQKEMFHHMIKETTQDKCVLTWSPLSGQVHPNPPHSITDLTDAFL